MLTDGHAPCHYCPPCVLHSLRDVLSKSTHAHVVCMFCYSGEFLILFHPILLIFIDKCLFALPITISNLMGSVIANNSSSLGQNSFSPSVCLKTVNSHLTSFPLYHAHCFSYNSSVVLWQLCYIVSWTSFLHYSYITFNSLVSLHHDHLSFHYSYITFSSLVAF